ncbi:MAG: ABC transporter permease subunit [Myxococcales bacterium]|nr:ABC transporter permease subunit [Myxococcales bacterium]
MTRKLWEALPTLLHGEFLLQLRQPLAMLLLVVVPVLIVPGGLLSAEVYTTSLERAATGRLSGTVAARPTVMIAADETFREWIRPDDHLVVVRGAVLPQAGEVVEGDALAAVAVDGDTVQVDYRRDLSASREALSRIQAVAGRQRLARVDGALAEQGITLSSRDVVVVSSVDRADSDRRGGDRLGAMLPPLLVFCIVMVSIYTALDVVSGEKERGTIETLLVSASDRRAVVVAKTLITLGMAVGSAWIGLASLGVVAVSGWLELPMMLGGQGLRALSVGSLLTLAGAVVLLSAQSAGLALVLATWAPDYRTGSMISGPAMLLVLGPSAVALLPGIELTPTMAMIPIANVSLACRALLAGELTVGPAALVLGATLVHVGITGFVTYRLLERESALVPGQTRSSHARGRPLCDAALVWSAALFLSGFVGRVVSSGSAVWGELFVQVGLYGGLAVGAASLLAVDRQRTLALIRPSATDLVLAMLAGLCLPAVAHVAALGQTGWWPVVGSGATGVVVFAWVPAVFEELLFRGVLLSLLLRALPSGVAVVVGALAFGVFQLDGAAVWPMSAAGLWLGWIVVRTGSVWPAVVMHAVFRTVLVVAPEMWLPGWAIGGLAVASVGFVAATARPYGGARLVGRER